MIPAKTVPEFLAIKAHLANLDVKTTTMTPAQFGQYIADDIEEWRSGLPTTASGSQPEDLAGTGLLESVKLDFVGLRPTLLRRSVTHHRAWDVWCFKKSASKLQSVCG
jgi:hypothetical protein